MNQLYDFFFSQKQWLSIQACAPLSGGNGLPNYFKGQHYTECANVDIYPNKKNNWDDCAYLGTGTSADISHQTSNKGKRSSLSQYYSELLYKQFPEIKSVCVYYQGKYKNRQYLRVTLKQPDQNAMNTFQAIRCFLMVAKTPLIAALGLRIDLTSSSNCKGTFRLNSASLRPCRYVTLPLTRRKKTFANTRLPMSFNPFKKGGFLNNMGIYTQNSALVNNP